MNPPEPSIPFSQFAGVDVRAGTIRSAEPHARARRPAYVLAIDFGPLGVKASSAQLTEHYRPEELIGRQVLAVVNLPPKRVAGVVSEVLVLAAVSETEGTVLLRPDGPVADGTRVA